MTAVAMATLGGTGGDAMLITIGTAAAAAIGGTDGGKGWK